MGEEAVIFKAQYLYGNHGGRCGGEQHTREGRLLAHAALGAHYPGRSAGSSIAKAVDNRRREEPLSRQKSADDVVGGIDPTEGRNMNWRMRALSFDVEGETE
jgi:hypothetical protein